MSAPVGSGGGGPLCHDRRRRNVDEAAVSTMGNSPISTASPSSTPTRVGLSGDRRRDPGDDRRRERPGRFKRAEPRTTSETLSSWTRATDGRWGGRERYSPRRWGCDLAVSDESDYAAISGAFVRRRDERMGRRFRRRYTRDGRRRSTRGCLRRAEQALGCIDVCFVDANRGWIVGQGTRFSRRPTGGRLWEPQTNGVVGTDADSSTASPSSMRQRAGWSVIGNSDRCDRHQDNRRRAVVDLLQETGVSRGTSRTLSLSTSITGGP